MITVFPSYYPDFSCIADQCRHSCCIGWEIDIDPDSLCRYEALEGTAGDYIRQGIDCTDTPHFRLTEGERCFFLRQDGLCQMYRLLGEEALCQICTDHPRFRTFLPGRTEIGLGLCCEEAARLILSRTEPVHILRRGRSEEPESPSLRRALKLRRQAMAAVQNRTKPLPARLEDLLTLTGGHIPPEAVSPTFFRRLERLDKSWDAVLDLLTLPVDENGFARHMAARETEYEQLTVYFLYRHLLAGDIPEDIPARAAFAVLSVRLLRQAGAALWTRHGDFTFAQQVELARMYSGEIEYSDENLSTVLAIL